LRHNGRGSGERVTADDEEFRIRADDSDATDTDDCGPAPRSIGNPDCLAVLFVSLRVSYLVTILRFEAG
jgi:hypothetical protein